MIKTVLTSNISNLSKAQNMALRITKIKQILKYCQSLTSLYFSENIYKGPLYSFSAPIQGTLNLQPDPVLIKTIFF